MSKKSGNKNLSCLIYKISTKITQMKETLNEQIIKA